jgi:hypothetical protein
MPLFVKLVFANAPGRIHEAEISAIVRGSL